MTTSNQVPPRPSMQVPHLIRWILIIPAAIAAWCVAVLVCVGIYEGLDALCPEDQRVSGACVAPWFRLAWKALIPFGAGLAAVLIMLSSAWLAPVYKREVAFITFALGTAVAVIMALMGRSGAFFAPMVVAVGAGGFVLGVLLRRFRAPDESPGAG